MRILKDAGLVKALLVAAVLAAANLYVIVRENTLEAQGGTPRADSICVNQGLIDAHCEMHPIAECVYETCVDTALEP